MKIASIQMNIAWENQPKNLKMAEEHAKNALLNECDVIVFPEMFNSGFSMNISQIAETKQGKTFQFLSHLAQQYKLNIVAGISEMSTINKAENIALVFNRDGKQLARYVKNYSFNMAQEGRFFNQSNEQSIFDIDGIKSSVFICYDLRFPEVFRKIATQVDVLFIIANWPEKRHQHWEALIKARAIENQCFVVAVNRTGKDGNSLEYIGGSQVIDPLGNILSNGDKDQTFVITKIDTTIIKSVRKKLPFLKDMKPLSS